MKPTFAAHTPPEGAHKQWHGLKEHLSDVAQAAQQMADKFGAAELGFYAGLWHDLGKYNPAFQEYLQQCQAASQSGAAEPKGKVPHAIYGAKLALEQFPPLAPLIFGHHAGLPQQTHMMNRLAQMDDGVYQAILHQAQAEDIDLTIAQAASQQITALAHDPFSFDLLLRMLFSCLVDADYLDTEDHFSPEIAARRGARVTVAQLWHTLQAAQQALATQVDATPVNQIRAEVYQACQDAVPLEPGVFRLAVPTGGGKTRSGLAFALAHAVHYGLERVIVAVPYTSIIEQTVEVYRGIFGQEAVLEHHSAIRPEQGNRPYRKLSL